VLYQSDPAQRHRIPRTGGVCYDLGSGVGRPAFTAATLHPFEKVVGVECLAGLHALGTELTAGAWPLFPRMFAHVASVHHRRPRPDSLLIVHLCTTTAAAALLVAAVQGLTTPSLFGLTEVTLREATGVIPT